MCSNSRYLRTEPSHPGVSWVAGGERCDDFPLSVEKGITMSIRLLKTYTDRRPLTIIHTNQHEPPPATHRILSGSTRPALHGERPAFCSPIRSRTETRKRTTNQNERKVMNNSKNNESKKVRGMSRKQFLKTSIAAASVLALLGAMATSASAQDARPV